MHDYKDDDIPPFASLKMNDVSFFSILGNGFTQSFSVDFEATACDPVTFTVEIYSDQHPEECFSASFASTSAEPPFVGIHGT